MAEAVTIARPYAVAVYRLAKEKNALGKWSETLALINAVVADAQMQAITNDPKNGKADIERILLAVFGDKLEEPAVNLVKVLVEYDRLALLPEIVTIFEELKDLDEGTLDAEITSAVALSDAQVKTLVAQLQAKFGKKVEAKVSVDPEIIGGIKIIVGDTVIDASVRGRLQELAYTLKG